MDGALKSTPLSLRLVQIMCPSRAWLLALMIAQIDPNHGPSHDPITHFPNHVGPHHAGLACDVRSSTQHSHSQPISRDRRCLFVLGSQGSPEQYHPAMGDLGIGGPDTCSFGWVVQTW